MNDMSNFELIHTIDYHKTLPNDYYDSEILVKLNETLLEIDLLYFYNNVDENKYYIYKIPKKIWLDFTLEDKQSLVDGYIEIVTYSLDPYFLIINEEGLIYRLPSNWAFDIFGRELFEHKLLSMRGNVIIADKSILLEEQEKEIIDNFEDYEYDEDNCKSCDSSSWCHVVDKDNENECCLCDYENSRITGLCLGCNERLDQDHENDLLEETRENEYI